MALEYTSVHFHSSSGRSGADELKNPAFMAKGLYLLIEDWISMIGSVMHPANQG